MKMILSALAVTFAMVGAVRAEDEKTITEIVVGADDFSTLKAAVVAADLAETLGGEGPFTVFAPTNAAFAKIPEADLAALLKDKEKLKKVLLAHVVVGKAVMAADVVKLDGKMVKGQKLVVEDGKVTIGGATVTKTDIKASNGVIHVIDTVLMPKAKKKN